jgi:hypothetical protein
MNSVGRSASLLIGTHMRNMQVQVCADTRHAIPMHTPCPHAYNRTSPASPSALAPGCASPSAPPPPAAEQPPCTPALLPAAPPLHAAPPPGADPVAGAPGWRVGKVDFGWNEERAREDEHVSCVCGRNESGAKL